MELIAKLDELIIVIAKTREVVIKENKKQAAREEIAHKSQQAIIVRNADLDQREEAIKKIEDIVVLNAKTKAIEADIGLKTANFNKQRNDFEVYVTSAKKDIAEARAKNSQERQLNEQEAKALAKVRVESEKEKDDYKLKLAKTLVDGADKR